MEFLEAPKPIFTKASFEQLSSITLKENSSESILNFGLFEDSIYFELYELKNENYKYIGIYNLNALKNINFWFNQFSSIEKVVKIFKSLMNSKKIKISEGKNNSRNIFFSNPIEEEDIIYIELNKKEKSEKETIKDLSKLVNDLTEKNFVLENKIDKLEKLFKEKISSMEQQINEIKINMQNKNSELGEETIDSLIISEKEDIKLLKNWISNDKNLELKLIYRATRDGDTEKDFHKKCDNIYPTISILKTPKGYIFGGYTTILFNNPNNRDIDLKDESAFVFSLNRKKKFVTQDKKVSICLRPGYLIVFGNGSNSIQIENNALKSEGHWSNPSGSYGSNLNLTENKNFSIQEFEIFQVIYI